MNWLDIVIVLVIAFFAISAFRAGLIREVVTLVSVAVGVVVAGLFYDDLARDVLVFINDHDARQVVAFLILLGAVYLAGQLIAGMLKRAASLLLLGMADHAGGALFGLIKGLIVVEVLLILLVTYPQLGLQSDIDGSAIASVFLDAAPLLLLVLPDEFEQAVDAFVA
ncbi:MAG: CvpA family protein [Chloroflexi bacterium]|nr:CvpA family protein [Chloroflexota bacterium]MCH8346245.1 CvpA family protein [Chloroflexota bacterium]